MTSTVHEQRLDRCRDTMRRFDLEALILTPGAAMQYLTGFSEHGYERLLCLIVPSTQAPIFITPTLNAEQAKANPGGIAEIRAWSDNEGWHGLLESVCLEMGLNAGMVGVDENMPARFILPLFDIVPPALVRSAGPVFVDIRSVKDAAEIEAMQKAADLTDRAYHAALAACRPGVTESALAQVVLQTIIDGGGEVAFDTIIGSGPNSALPHHGAGSRAIQDGEIVLFDLGARLGGYCGDITRVVSVGQPSAKASEIYDIVYRAHTEAVRSVRPGEPASFVDRVARQAITEAGYGEQFFHRTGHGIGLEDHEAPNIVHGNDTILAPGNCFSVEPGIYLAGEFGVRLENIVTVTMDGHRVLNEPIPARLTDIRELQTS